MEWWGVETFLSPETLDKRCPAVVDVTGPSRVLLYGPYKILTTGVWRATAFIEVCPDAARCRLEVEFGTHPNFSKIAVPFLVPGRHKLEIQHVVAEEGPAEVRIVLRRGGFTGELRFAGVTVERIADLESSAGAAGGWDEKNASKIA